MHFDFSTRHSDTVNSAATWDIHTPYRHTSSPLSIRLMRLGNSGCWLEPLGPSCHLDGFCPLASAWPTPGYYGHLGSKPMAGRSVTLNLFFRKRGKNTVDFHTPILNPAPVLSDQVKNLSIKL